MTTSSHFNRKSRRFPEKFLLSLILMGVFSVTICGVSTPILAGDLVQDPKTPPPPPPTTDKDQYLFSLLDLIRRMLHDYATAPSTDTTPPSPHNDAAGDIIDTYDENGISYVNSADIGTLYDIMCAFQDIYLQDPDYSWSDRSTDGSNMSPKASALQTTLDAMRGEVEYVYWYGN